MGNSELFPVQLIVTKKLSKEENLWLASLTNDLRGKEEVEKLIHAYEGHENNSLYKSVMNVIVTANKNEFKEAKKMCEALLELMKDELDEREKKGIELGVVKGEQQKLFEQIRKKIEKGKSLEQIADELEETEEAILPLYRQLMEL